VSERLARLSLRFVVAIALLGCLVPELPFGGQVHAATQPAVFSATILPSGTTGPTQYGIFTGKPGTTISIGPNGVITLSGAVGPNGAITVPGAAVHVTPNPGYVLARFNPGTGQWQAVPNNTIPPGTGATYALISGQPVTIPSSGHMSLARGTVTGPPGTAVTVGSTGVITVSGTTQPVQVTPSPGYVLALYNPTTGQWQPVPNNTIVPGSGTYALKSRNSVSTRCATSQAPASKQKGRVTKAPKKGRVTKAPKKGRVTKAPKKGRVTKAPKKGRVTKAPKKGRVTKAPKKGRVTKAPKKGRVTKAPKKGRVTKAPKKGRATKAPKKGRATKAPKQKATVTPGC
jgi:hypothetical protein